jgi:hypothetical protein
LQGEPNENAQNIKSNSDNENGEEENIAAKKGTQLVKDSSNRAEYVPHKKTGRHC